MSCCPDSNEDPRKEAIHTKKEKNLSYSDDEETVELVDVLTPLQRAELEK